MFEKSGRLGGVIQTERRDGFVIEAGPDSFLSAKPDGARLCHDLGIGDQLISSNDADRKTYILVKGRLVPIPQGLEFMVPTRVWPMATTPLFSFKTKLRMASELFSSARKEAGDESVGDFVRRHFGQEMVDRVAEPLLAGVYGGNAEHLSIRAVLPRFAEMECEHGSLVRATLKAKAQFKSESTGWIKTAATVYVVEKRHAADGRSAGGRTAASLHPIGTAESLVAPANDDWQIESAGINEKFQAVLLAVPAPSAAALLRQFHPALIEGLGKIEYTSSAAVALARRGQSAAWAWLPGSAIRRAQDNGLHLRPQKISAPRAGRNETSALLLFQFAHAGPAPA